MAMDEFGWKLLVFAFYLSLVLYFTLEASDTYGKPRPAEAIPRIAFKYRSDLIRNARFIWGLDAPTSTFAGQVHAESSWRADAHDTTSTASGLAQFTVGTARWMAKRHPDLKPAAPLSPAWALRALVRLDKYLWDKAKGGPCPRMRLVLAGYNAGESRMYKRWPAETRRYVARVLNVLEPIYESAGWGLGSCP